MTSKARPTAASQAAKTKMMMIGNISDKVILKFRIIRVAVIKIGNIKSSRHRRDQ
jgi:hypothetical protein